MNRRQFAKIAGGAALAVPLAPLMADARGGPTIAWPQEPAKKPEPQPLQQSEPKLKLSKEQEEAVKKAVARRDRQLAAMRSRALPYDAEPAFVFQVRQRTHSGRKG